MVKTETDRKQLGPLNTLTFISLSQIIQLSFIYNVIQWYAIKYACHFTERPNSNEIFGDMQNGTVFGVLCKNDDQGIQTNLYSYKKGLFGITFICISSLSEIILTEF
jgi:hypothetical protein